jgi:DNA-directed RNA polymerase I, II, and III subunit RPABC1
MYTYIYTGYIVDEEDVNMTTDDFKMKFGDDPSRESLTILVEKADDPTDQLFGKYIYTFV